MQDVSRGTWVRSGGKFEFGLCCSTWNYSLPLAPTFLRIFRSDKQEPTQGIWHQNRFPPIPCRDPSNLVQITRTSPEDNFLCGHSLRSRPVKQRPKLTHRARAHEIQRGYLFPQLFIATDQDAGVRKSKLAHHFREKRGLFHIAFNHDNVQILAHKLNRKAWKPGS